MSEKVGGECGVFGVGLVGGEVLFSFRQPYRQFQNIPVIGSRALGTFITGTKTSEAPLNAVLLQLSFKLLSLITTENVIFARYSH
ncbi:hypothetical protein J6590_053366 [Homalodisca vitripennis]|nr:hypothetical protein J6590_053366 [Homalodisca vitripennis]